MVFQTPTDQLEGHFQDTGTLFKIETNPAMFTLLTSKLYTYPAKAVIREWSTNAIDACIASNKPVRFDVHLPTPLQPYFKVRDYGSGLSNDSINSLYCTLGASTKRSSNELTGSFGIGRLAGLSYGAAFTITSYYEGKASTFIVHSEQGALKLNSLGSTPSSEEPGLEVTVQVPINDIGKFTEEATQIYSWFSTLPSCNKPLSKAYTPEVGEWGLTEDKHWSTGLLLMGNIIYPLEDSDLTGILIHAPIGAVSVTPNREALVLDAPTVRYLNEIKVDVKKNFHGNTQKTLSTLPTVKDKILMVLRRARRYNTLLGTPPPINELLPEVAHLLDWAPHRGFRHSSQELWVAFMTDTKRVRKIAHKYSYGKRPSSCPYVRFADWIDCDTLIVLVDTPLASRDYLHSAIDGKRVLFVTPGGDTPDEVNYETSQIEKDLVTLGFSFVRSSTFVAPAGKRAKVKITEIKGIKAVFTETRGRIGKTDSRPVPLDENQEYLYQAVNGAVCEIPIPLEMVYRLFKRVGTPLPEVVFIQQQYLPLLKDRSNFRPLKEALQLLLDSTAFMVKQNNLCQWDTRTVDYILGCKNAPRDVFTKALAEKSLAAQYHITADDAETIRAEFTFHTYESYVPYTLEELWEPYPLLHLLTFTYDGPPKLEHYFSIETAEPLPVKKEDYSQNDPIEPVTK